MAGILCHFLELILGVSGREPRHRLYDFCFMLARDVKGAAEQL